MNRHEELVEDSMFGGQFVTTAEEIEEAREALIELSKEVTRRRMDAEFNEAQIVFANANARMELAPPGDDEATKAAEAANRRLLALFKKGWARGDKLLFHCYREYKKRLCYHHRAEGESFPRSFRRKKPLESRSFYRYSEPQLLWLTF